MASMDDLLGSLDDQAEQKQQQADKAASSAQAKQNTDKIVGAVDKSTQATADGLKSVKGEVKVTNPTDVSGVVDSINKLNLTTYMQNEGLPKLAQNLSDLSGKTQDLQDKLENEGLKKMSDQLGLVVKKLDEVSKTLSKTEVSVDAKLQKTIDNLSKSINAIDFKPSVNVATPQTKVVTTPVDLKPLLSALASVEQAIKDSEKEETEQDLTPITAGLSAVQNAITALRFPVPNYVLPFRNSQGKADQVQLNSDGTIPVQATISTAGLATSTKQSDGSQKTQIVDGSGNVIGATSNALDINVKSGNPTMIGSSTATGSTVPANAFYQGVNAQTALPTAATAGNLTGATSDKFGRAVVLSGTIRDLVGTQTTTISASTAETTIVTAAAAVFNDLTTLIISNTSATAARVDLRDTTGGSILFSLYIPAGDMRGFCPPRPLPQTSANTNWTAQSSASVTDLRVYCVFDKNK